MNSATLLAIAGLFSVLGLVSSIVWFISQGFRRKNGIVYGDLLIFIMLLALTVPFSIVFWGLALNGVPETGEPIPMGIAISVVSFFLAIILAFYAMYRKESNLNNNELFKKKAITLPNDNNDELNSSLANHLNQKAQNRVSKEQVESRN